MVDSAELERITEEIEARVFIRQTTYCCQSKGNRRTPNNCGSGRRSIGKSRRRCENQSPQKHEEKDAGIADEAAAEAELEKEKRLVEESAEVET